MDEFYISLVGPLCGYYLKATADKKETVRTYAAAKFQKLFCAVYRPAEIEGDKHFDKSKVIGAKIRLTVEDGEIYDNY